MNGDNSGITIINVYYAFKWARTFKTLVWSINMWSSRKSVNRVQLPMENTDCGGLGSTEIETRLVTHCT